MKGPTENGLRWRYRMLTPYSIRAKLGLLFLVAALIFGGGSMVTLHLIRQILSSTEVFVTRTLPGIGTASELALTARDITVHAERLSAAPNGAELEKAFSGVSRLLDRLEALTAEVSREGGAADVLRLNRLSQSIRSRAQLAFQFANQRFILQGRMQTAIGATEAAIAKLLTALSADPSAPQLPRTHPDNSELPDLPEHWNDARHSEDDPVSDANRSFRTLLSRLTLRMTRTLHHALHAATPEQIDALHGEFMDTTGRLAEALRPFLVRHPEYHLPLATALSWPQKAGWGEPFTLRRREIVLEASTGKFLAEVGLYANKLSEITADHSNGVFEQFRESAREVIAKERQAILLVVICLALSVLILFLWGMVVQGFASRLTVISSAMGKVPTRSTHTKVPVGGHDEIATMARELEGLLEKALQTHRMATIDELTQANNRRRFFELVSFEVERVKRRRSDSCIMMLDIDNFKKINDTCGHHAGDRVLIAFSTACRRLVRGVDIFARLGGEEFALFMPETSEEGGKVVAQRICREIEQAHMAISSSATRQITVSIGMAVFCLRDTTIETAMKQADKALYRAKAAGRNQVVIARPDPDSASSRDIPDATPESPIRQDDNPTHRPHDR